MKDQKKDKKTLEQPSPSCCPGVNVPVVKLIDVGGMKIGIRGIDEIFKTYCDSGNAGKCE